MPSSPDTAPDFSSRALPPAEPSTLASDRRKKWWLGVAYILIVAVIWTAASVLKQFIFHTMEFNHPLFVTVFCNACYVVQFFSVFVVTWRGKQKKSGQAARSAERRGDDKSPAVDPENPDEEADWPTAQYNENAQHSPGGAVSSSEIGVAVDQPAVLPHLAGITVADDNTTTATDGTSTATSTFERPLIANQGTTNHNHETNILTEQRPRIWDRRHAFLALLISPIWFIAQWSYAQGLNLTSVTSSTVISTTSCVPTFLLSLLFLREKQTGAKWLGVIFCVVGNVIVALSSSGAPGGEASTTGTTSGEANNKPTTMSSDTTAATSSTSSKEDELFLFLLSSSQTTSGAKDATLVGDVLCLISTVFYASYVTIIKKHVTKPLWLFAYLGLYVFIIGFPLAYAFDPEPFHELNWTIVGLLLLNGIGDNVLAQYFWAYAVLYSSPTVATVGLSFTIPLSMLSDLFFSSVGVSIWQVLAAISVTFGFVILSMNSSSSA
ncbi:unnamed protein product [Amoebophrya sp. A120]|nr:unnamed protein product [Amoebophrya sp. A120]|eukprot:GSA120T00023341001.1